MQITTAELKRNLDKYLELIDTEEIFISLSGKIVAKSLFGIISDDITLEEAKEERLKQL